MNPTDAARKQARKKEIARNKLERDLQRATPKDVSEISKRLEELIDEEESEKERGRPLSKQLHIRRKVLQDAMKLAVAKERVWAPSLVNVLNPRFWHWTPCWAGFSHSTPFAIYCSYRTHGIS